MKKFLFGLLILSLAFLFTGCEKYGNAGNVYLKFTWTYSQPHTFTTNNSAIPTIFYYGVDYQSNPGTYSLYYETFYGVNYWWSVNYTLTSKPGQAGNIDGDDSMFTINCAPNGPYFYQTKSSDSLNVQVQIGTIDEYGYVVVESTPDRYVIEKTGIKLIYTRLTEKEFNKAIKDL
jgi:hypothetical protein